jgi:hypothetical protein
VKKLEQSVMSLSPHDLSMESETVLTQYIIKNWTLSFTNLTEPADGIRMEIVLKRRIMNSVLTVYLPTILVLFIVYATNYFKEFFFEAVVSVNLTSLLVLTTLFISVSDSLPKTAYVKMIDIWLIFVQLVPWLEVLLHTAMDLMRTDDTEEEDEGKGREINHHGKIITVGGKTEDGKTEDGKTVGGKTEDLPSWAQAADTVKSKELVQLDEGKMVGARKEFYENAKLINKNNKILKWLQFSGGSTQ